MNNVDVVAIIHCYKADSSYTTETAALLSVYHHHELVRIDIGPDTFYFRRDELEAALAATAAAKGPGW